MILCLIVEVFKVFPNDLKIYFIDVGQGDSTLIVTPLNKKILIDGGGSELGSYDVGKNTLLPYLLDRKIKNIDYIIVSHFDTDHVQGLLVVMENLKVKNVIIGKQFEFSENYERFLKIVKEKEINVKVVEAGNKIHIENNIYLDVIWPICNMAVTKNSINNNALVCKFNFKNFSMLFTGDIEKEAEDIIVSKYQDTTILKSNVLKVAHHGSKTSSTQELLELVKPKIALIGVGENNTFGHPNKEILDRLQNLGTKICRTDKMGEISIDVKNNGKIKCYNSQF